MLPLVLLAIVLPFGIGAVFGAPYLPILRRDSKHILELANLKPGQTLIDLGSGDGRLLRAAAARGIHCIGYEINPYLVLLSRLVCWRYRKSVTVHTANLWNTRLPPADVIYIFGLDRHMTRMHQKLVAEITKPTRVISYIFALPGQKPIQQTSNTYVYEYGAHAKPTHQLEQTISSL